MKKLNGRAKIAVVAAALGLAGAVGLGAVAYAGEAHGQHGGAARGESNEQAQEAREAQMLAQARVSAADAARAAEQQTGLKASEVELDDEAATPAWEVSLGSGANERVAIVDAITGQVRSVSADDGEAGEGAEDAD